jgi:hypothetical protein
MRKTLLKIITLLSILGCGQVIATTGELRTPLAKFPFHYPLAPVDDGLWSINMFADCYMRTADQGFGRCNGTNKVPLAQLFFGKTTFQGQEAFAGGIISTPGVAALKYVNMHPRFSYTEKGVNFAVETEKRWDDSKWRVGGQLSMPFKVIDLERNVCSATMVDTGTNNLNGLVCRRSETLLNTAVASVPTTACVPAYRLDFLTNLGLVEYGNHSVRIAEIEVAGSLGHSDGGRPAVAALYSANGTCSTQQYATPRASLNALGVNGISTMLGNTVDNRSVINADGTLTTGANAEVNRAGFNNVTDYTNLGTLVGAQAKLYIVPGYDNNPLEGNTTRFETEAAIIMDAIEDAISELESNGEAMAEQWFYNQGVKFCQDHHMVGLGDMDLDLYVGYDFTKEFWGKLVAGVVFPTGKKICDPLLLLAQPTGNNGHFEIKLGADFGWKACKWLGFDLDASYNFVLQASEWRGAPFTGATIKNIGPKIQAKTKWGYFTGHFDISVFHPENQNLGFTLGYEAYVKQCDKIKLCDTTAVQFPISSCCGSCAVQNATAQTLDCSILAQDTKRISHKIRGEVFHRWSYCELFAGASSVFAGKNIMKETECHAGVGIYW